MRRFTLPALAGALISAGPAFSQVTPTGSSGEPPVVVVSGQATESVPPDAVTIHILVRNLDPSPAEAASLNATRASAVVAAVERLDLEETTISRVGYSVAPQYDRDRVLRGYQASVNVRVETADLAAIGRVIDAAVDAGATEINRIEFTSSALGDARRRALAEAVRQARLDAEAMAEAADGSLGALLQLTTQDMGPTPVFARASFEADATLVTPEDLTVMARVQARWTFVARSGQVGASSGP